MCLMGRNFPNASILSLITQSEEDKEKVLFLYLKVVPDFSDVDNVCWLKGQRGIPHKVWSSLSINQWVAFGKDEVIQALLDNILKNEILRIGNVKEISLIMPPYVITPKEADPSYLLSKIEFQTFKTDVYDFISPLFYQKENLKILSGYYMMKTKEVKPLYPLGFYEDDFIYSSLKRNIIGVREFRTAYLKFHGVISKSKKEDGSKAIAGFYQQNFDKDATYSVMLENKSGTELGRSIINKNTGLFYMDVKEPIKSGVIRVFRNDELEKREDFIFVSNFVINMQMSSKELKDIYNRCFMIPSKKEIRPDHIQPFSWQKEVYVEIDIANEKLSDRFESLLNYLGPKILIADPYFLGNMKGSADQLSLFGDQLAFLNAMVLSYHKMGLEKVVVLGTWKRAKNQLSAEDMNGSADIFDRYKSCLQSIFAKNELGFEVLFLNTKVEFHNRYWFSLIEQDGIERLDKCIIITNSIGNIREVDFIPVMDESQRKQITSKYTYLYKNAKLRIEKCDS